MAMKNPYMPFWVNDYRTDREVRLMTYEEKGLYIDIILELWIEGSLPQETKELALIFNANPKRFERIFSKISKKFVFKDGFITHKRVTKERLKFQIKSEKAQLSGKLGGIATANARANAAPIAQPIAKNIEDPFFQKDTEVKQTKNNACLMKAISRWLEHKPTDSASRAWVHQLNGMGLPPEDVEKVVEAQISVFNQEGRERRYWPKLSKAIPDMDHAKELLSGAVIDRLRKSKNLPSNSGQDNAPKVDYKAQEAEWKKEIKEQGGPADPKEITKVLKSINKGCQDT